jgi:hypothetical protein
MPWFLPPGVCELRCHICNLELNSAAVCLFMSQRWGSETLFIEGINTTPHMSVEGSVCGIRDG